MVTLFVNGTLDYHYFLMTLSNKFLNDLIKNLGINPFICAIFFKENGIYKIIGNLGESFIKKEYENIPFKEGLYKIDNFDYFLMGENAFQHTPEIKYISTAYINGSYMYILLYFKEPVFIPNYKRDYIKQNFKQFKKLLLDFGLTGDYENTLFKRYAIQNELFEIKTLKNGHSKNVSKIVEIIADQLNLTKEEIILMKEAALLHDIGKIFMLKSKDPHLHQTIGAMLLNKISPLQKYAKIISNHHLIGKNITFEHQLLFISDYIENTLRNNAMINYKYLKEKITNKKLLSVIDDGLIERISGEITYE